MSCQTCLPISCIYDLDDADLYSMQGDPFRWVANCPAGFSCNPNPAGGTVSLQCCDEVIEKQFPASVSNAQYQSILAALVSECAARQAFCGELPPPTEQGGNTTILYWNRPQQCLTRCGDGSPFFYTVPAGRFLGASQQDADLAALRAACRLAFTHRICLSELPDTWCEGTAFNKTITASNAPYPDNFWSVPLGTLPPGITVDTGYGGNIVAISGTPTTPGLYTFTVKIVNHLGDFMSKVYTICIVGMTPTPPGSDSSHMPDAPLNVAYSNTLTAPGCATPPLSYQLKPGDALPTGLFLDDQTGVISGTPTVAGTYTFNIILQTEAS